MSDVFVSYSRQDRDAVATIVAALRAAGEDVWIDLEDITPSTLWMDEIKSAIAAADSMVFFLSPNSAHSEVCRTELGHAVELSKRIVPVVIQDVQTETVPPPLPDINWLFIRPESLDSDVARLVELLNTDIARVHMHTRLLVRANEWMVRTQDSSLLLRGAQLDEAERWLAGQSDQKPTTTPDQGRFIAASRRAATRRQRGSITAAIAITAIMALVATLAVVQWRNATVQRNNATAQRNAAVSRELAAYAQGSVTADPQLALILALRAYDSAPTAASQDAVRAAVRQSSVRAVLPADATSVGQERPIDPSVPVGHVGTDDPPARSGARGFDRSGNHVLAFDDRALIVWRWTQRGDDPDVLTLPVDEDLGRVQSAEFDRDGHVVFTIARDDTTEVFTWNVAGGPSIRPVTAFERTADSDGGVVGLSPDAKWALRPNSPGNGAFTLTSLQNPGEPPKTVDVGPSTSFSTFSPDGSLFAVLRVKDIALFRTTDASMVTSFPVDAGAVGAVAIRPDNRRVAIAIGSGILLVDVTPGVPPRLVKTLRVATPPGLPSPYNDVNQAGALAWSPNGQTLAVGTSDNSIRVFTGDADEPIYLNGDTDASGGLSFSDDGRFLLSTGRRVEVWEWSAAQTLTYFADAQPSPPVFTPDGNTVAVTGPDGVVTLRDTRRLGTRSLGIGIPRAFDADGHLLAVEEAAAVSVWDITRSAKVASLPLANPNYGPGNTYGFLVAKFDETGDVLAVLRRWPHPGQLWRWPWRTGEPAATLTDFADDQGVQAIVGWDSGSIDLIAESSLFAWAGSRPPEPAAKTSANFYDIRRAAYLTPTTLLLSYEQATKRWDTDSGQVTQILPDYSSSDFALSGDRGLIAIAGDDGFINMWDFQAPSPVYIGRYGAPPHIALDQDGSMLAVTDSSGTHLVPTAFAGRFPDVLARARTLVVRPLTSDEEERYLPS
ncbi:MAG TPA: toll/interleukin-1 receptor domain-containing protein [Mycobacterium sp.]|nr:toll/interleukin-1 receptor domain-containing protein [Mycobacterium sp.]